MKVTASDSYGIGAVSRLTGLSDHTIRVWERRYEAVVADRSSSGRRVYSTADVEKLRLLKLLTDKGVAISGIANEPVENLKQRLASMTDIEARAGLEKLDVGLVGDFLPKLVRDFSGSIGALTFVIVDSDLEQFEADLRHTPVDALVLELPTITPDLMNRVTSLRDMTSARFCIVVYTFARSLDVDELSANGISLLRAPVRLDEVATALSQLAAVSTTGPAPVVTGDAVAESDWTTGATPAPRRFTREQLAMLSRISSSIDCECPQHLAQLVADLAAFEVYSANCASRDEKDRALHDYLHRVSGHARASVEEALERVAKAEGIRY